MTAYSDLLKNPAWQKKRLEMLSAADFACQSCGDNSSTLHVHHKRYIKGRSPWDYENSNFVVVCED